MGMQDIDTCIGAFYCDATGYDSNSKKLIDKSGYGNHLDLKVAAAPVFATRGGLAVMDFDNTYYFEGESLLRSGGSCCIVGVADGTAADGQLALVNTLSRHGDVGNFDGVPQDAADSYWFTGTIGRKALQFSGNTPRIYDWVTGNGGTGANFTAGVANMFTGAISLSPPQTQGATRAEAVVASTYTSGARAARSGSVMRIGYLKEVGGLTAGKYLSLKRAYFFTGNVFEHSDFITQRAAEIAAWGL